MLTSKDHLPCWTCFNSTSWSRVATAWRRCTTSSSSRPTAPSSATPWSGGSCGLPAASPAASMVSSTDSFLFLRVASGKLLQSLLSFPHLNHFLSTIARMGDDGNGRYLMFGPGAHRIRSPFYNIDPRNVKITSPVIQHGTETIITVE